MSKRFTETLKWQDPWFRRLSAQAKLLWFYATDHCDNIGIVEIDLDFVSKDCGINITPDHFGELGNRMESIGEGKFFIPKFIPFQYGQLSASCPAHKKVIQAIEAHCIMQDSLGYHYPKARVTGRVLDTLQEKDRKKNGRGMEEGCGEKPQNQEPSFPEGFPETHKPSLALWWQHKKERREAYKPTGWSQLLKEWADKPTSDVVMAVEFSIRQNYQGLFAPKQQQPLNGCAAGKPKRPQSCL